MIREHISGYVNIYGISVLELADPYVFDGVDDEGATAVFGGFVQLEIFPKIFVDGLGVGPENGGGVIRD